jgi:hypothetical protein
MEIIDYKNTMDEDCVIVTNDDGTSWSGFKYAYEEMLKQAEQSTPNVAAE